MNLEALKRNSSNFTHRVVNSELTIQEIELKKIIPDPNQPRKEFDPEQLSELAESRSCSEKSPLTNTSSLPGNGG